MQYRCVQYHVILHCSILHGHAIFAASHIILEIILLVSNYVFFVQVGRRCRRARTTNDSHQGSTGSRASRASRGSRTSPVSHCSRRSQGSSTSNFSVMSLDRPVRKRRKPTLPMITGKRQRRNTASST